MGKSKKFGKGIERYLPRRNLESFGGIGNQSFYQRSRGRNSYYPRRGYPRSTSYFNARPPSRAVSPVEGSEEFNLRRIQHTSAKIMRQLLSPEDPVVSNLSLQEKNNSSNIEPKVNPVDSVNRNKQKICLKGKKNLTNIPMNVDVQEIYHKIINHITNLNQGRKMNLINSKSSGLDVAFRQINTQKRLELSKVLRDMCSSPGNSEESKELINSIIPDIGIHIEQLPIDVIEQLRQTLNLDLNMDLSEIHSLPDNNCSIISISSDEFDETNSVQKEVLLNSSEIKVEDMEESFDSQILGRNLVCNTEESEKVVECLSQKTVKSLHHSFDIKEEPAWGDTNTQSSNPHKSDTVHINNKASIHNMNNLNITDPNEVLLMNTTGDWNCDTISNFSKKTVSSPPNEPAIVTNDVFSRNLESEETKLHLFRDMSCQTDTPNCSKDQSLQFCLQNFTENYGCDISSIEEVQKKLDLVDNCVKKLLDYRQSIFKAYCYSVKELTNNKSTVSSCCSNTDIQGVSTSSQDKRVLEKRKVSNCLEIINEPPFPEEISTEHPQTNKLPDILKFPMIPDKVLVIQTIEDELVIGTESGKILFLSIKCGCITSRIDVTHVAITSLQFVKTPDGNSFIYVGSMEKVLRVYDHNKKLIKVTPLEDKILCMDSMWGYVFMGCEGGTLIRYSCQRKKIEFSVKHIASSIMVIRAVKEGSRKVIVVGHRNAPVYVRDAMSCLFLRNFSNEAISTSVYSILIYNNLLYCGTPSNNILVFSFHEGFLIHKLLAKECKGISCMSIFNNLLFAGCYDGCVYVYSIDMQNLLATLCGPGGSILCMEVLKNQVIVGTILNKFASIPFSDNLIGT